MITDIRFLCFLMHWFLLIPCFCFCFFLVSLISKFLLTLIYLSSGCQVSQVIFVSKFPHLLLWIFLHFLKKQKEWLKGHWAQAAKLDTCLCSDFFFFFNWQSRGIKTRGENKNSCQDRESKSLDSSLWHDMFKYLLVTVCQLVFHQMMWHNATWHNNCFWQKCKEKSLSALLVKK